MTDLTFRNRADQSPPSPTVVSALTDLARGVSDPDKIEATSPQAAQGAWENAQAVPMMMLIAIGLASVWATHAAFGAGAGSYLGLMVFAICSVVILGRLNQSHKDAFVNHRIAEGASLWEAQDAYRARYGD
jgi:hypothetical protein